MGQDIRLKTIAKELNVGVNTIVEFLHKKGYVIDANPNTKIDSGQYAMLIKEYSSDMMAKKQMEKQVEIDKKRKENITAEKEQTNKPQNNAAETTNQSNPKPEIKLVGKIDLGQNKTKTTNTQQQQKTADDNKQKQPVQQDNTKTENSGNQGSQQKNDNKKNQQGNRPQR